MGRDTDLGSDGTTLEYRHSKECRGRGDKSEIASGMDTLAMTHMAGTGLASADQNEVGGELRQREGKQVEIGVIHGIRFICVFV